MNRINEIGDTPKGQYMLGRLSQSYDEPNLYTDDYDEKPEIASYASDNWHGYGRGDDNENAFNLGRGDEEGVRWIDDGGQRRFRERHGLPPMNRQLHKESKHKDMGRINEIGDTPKGQYALGQLAGKYEKMANDTKTGTKAHRKAMGKMWGMRQYANATPHKKGDDFENGHNDYLKKNESKNMNKTLIRLTEQDLHRIVKESVNKILSEVEFRGRAFHGNRQDDWRKMANIRQGLKMDADRGETDAINGYNNSFDQQDAKEAEYWRNASKKHSRNADRNMNNYRDMGNQ